MKAFTIGPNDAGQRLDKFLTKAVPLLPQALLYKSIRLKRIKVNGKRAEISTRLAGGDRVELWLNDEFFAPPKDDPRAFLKAPALIDVVYEDENLLLIDKKPGLVCHEDEDGSPDTLLGRVKRVLYERGEWNPDAENSFAPALCNRIDRNTGGLVLAAKNAPALRILNEKLRAREIEKFYLCVSQGAPEPPEGVLEGYLTKDEREKKVTVRSTAKGGGVPIQTRYRVISERGPLALLEVELLTGRTHQIRAHLASIGHPLLGDGKYGDYDLNRAHRMKWQALYSWRVRFAFPTDAGILNYLRDQSFEAKDIWFRDAFYEGKL